MFWLSLLKASTVYFHQILAGLRFPFFVVSHSYVFQHFRILCLCKNLTIQTECLSFENMSQSKAKVGVSIQLDQCFSTDVPRRFLFVPPRVNFINVLMRSFYACRSQKYKKTVKSPLGKKLTDLLCYCTSVDLCFTQFTQVWWNWPQISEILVRMFIIWSVFILGWVAKHFLLKRLRNTVGVFLLVTILTNHGLLQLKYNSIEIQKIVSWNVFGKTFFCLWEVLKPFLRLLEISRNGRNSELSILAIFSIEKKKFKL